MTFGAVSKAPHGGIFAIAVGAVSNPIMYLLALALGSVLGAILLIVSLNLGKKQKNNINIENNTEVYILWCCLSYGKGI